MGRGNRGKEWNLGEKEWEEIHGMCLGQSYSIIMLIAHLFCLPDAEASAGMYHAAGTSMQGMWTEGDETLHTGEMVFTNQMNKDPANATAGENKTVEEGATEGGMKEPAKDSNEAEVKTEEGSKPQEKQNAHDGGWTGVLSVFCIAVHELLSYLHH